MGLDKLEAEVVNKMISSGFVGVVERDFDPTSIVVTDREFSGVGFITNIARSPFAKLYSDDVSARWTKATGRVNSSVDVGFLVFIDEGYLTGIEAYTYAEEWPRQVETFEITLLPRE